MRGCLVTLEGGEGAGKSTQIHRLAAELRRRGIDVVETREPGGSPRAERLRKVILQGSGRRYGPFAEALLFAVARADHVEKTVRPALARGAVVLCDRFTDSTRVYQGSLAGVPRSVLATLERLSRGDAVPDLTLVLDVPAKLGLARAAYRRERQGENVDRFEAESVAFHEAVRRGFLDLAAAEPDRCEVVDAGGAPDDVEALVRAAVIDRLFTRDRDA
jgi:dTMP kinase